MVIRGGTRGNGKQLADYLVSLAENESIQILEVDSRTGNAATFKNLDDVLVSMELMSELTKSKKGLYHAQINPAYSEDKNMDWFKAADMLGKELGFENQRRVIVLHEKKGRTHAHVVWERYDYGTGLIKSDSFSRLHQDRARQNMEIEFGHQRTAKRNVARPALKASLLQLWQQTGTGAQFIHACKNNGYMIAEGVGRHPFMVVDEHGRTFDLVRQLNGVRLKEVRERLRNETLIKEKAAIIYMRNKQVQQEKVIEAEQQKTNKAHEQKLDKLMQDFKANAPDNTDTKQPAQELAKEFAENRQDKILTERERIRQSLAEERQARYEREQQQKQQGYDPSRDRGLEFE